MKRIKNDLPAHQGMKGVSLVHPLFDLELLYILLTLDRNRDEGWRYTKLEKYLKEEFHCTERVLQLRLKKLRAWQLIKIEAATNEASPLTRPWIVYKISGLGIKVSEKLDLEQMFKNMIKLEKEVEDIVGFKILPTNDIWVTKEEISINAVQNTQ